MKTINIECPECGIGHQVEIPEKCGMFDFICPDCGIENEFVKKDYY